LQDFHAIELRITEMVEELQSMQLKVKTERNLLTTKEANVSLVMFRVSNQKVAVYTPTIIIRVIKGMSFCNCAGFWSH